MTKHRIVAQAMSIAHLRFCRHSWRLKHRPPFRLSPCYQAPTGK